MTLELIRAVASWGVIPVLVLGAWALWAVAGLTQWTWGASVAAALGVGAGWHWSPPGVLDAAVLALLVCYVVECLTHPRADCWWCKGSPKRRDSRRNFHFCLVCGGKGHRVRWGAMVRPKFRASEEED
jgi:hypothetical protein